MGIGFADAALVGVCFSVVRPTTGAAPFRTFSIFP
jgi:hypothetical protein